MTEQVQLFSDDEYDRIIASASDELSDDDVIAIVRYCEKARVEWVRVRIIMSGNVTVIGILPSGEPFFDERCLTRAGADAPGAPESKQDSPADAPLDAARGSA